MKKIIFIGTLLLSSVTFGQQGSWFTGGNVGFNVRSVSQGTTTSKNYNYLASPEIGKYLTDHLQLGLRLNVNGINNLKTYSNIQMGGGVFSRYLFGDLAFKPFVGLQVGYQYGIIDDNFYTHYSNSINSSISVGFAYELSPRIAVYGSLGALGYSFQRTTANTLPDENEHNFGFNAGTLGNRFTIGLYYSFGNKSSSK